MTEKEKLLGRIDFSKPGLEEAKQCFEKDDLEGCLDAVVRYFRERQSPCYLFSFEDLKKCKDPLVAEEAENTMRHFIYGYQFEGDIDWMFNPTKDTSHDNEWSWSLFRNIYWQPLAREYALSGDEKYAVEFAKQLRSFAQAWPVDDFLNDSTFEAKFKFPGHAWRTIETGMRIYTTWLVCFVAFRNSPSIDNETWAVYLNMVYDHAQYLMTHYSNHERSSNWLSMECSAMFQCGVFFPEFKEASNWFHTGYQRVMHEVRYCFDNDGVHMERTPIYHMVASIAFLQAYRMCILNGIVVPPYMLPQLEKSAEFIMLLVKPDLSTPMIGDADRDDLTTSRSDTSLYEGMNLSFNPEDLNEMRAYFRTMAQLTGRKDFLYFATERKRGQAPKKLDYALKEAGIYVVRTGWEAKDSYFLVHGVQLERGEKSTHSHNDQGHLELNIKGEDVLIDCGRYIYNSSCWKNWRHYFTSVCAHNTLYVDDHEMGTVPNVTRVRGVRTFCHDFGKKEGYSLIDISHNGYAFMDDPIFHRRRVIRLDQDIYIIDDQMTGLGEKGHDLRMYFNFAPGKLELRGGSSYSYTTGKGTSFDFESFSNKRVDSVMLCGSEDPIGGWVSYGYSKRIPTPQLYLHSFQSVPLRMISVISPKGIRAKATVAMDKACLTIGSVVVDLEGEAIRITKKGE